MNGLLVLLLLFGAPAFAGEKTRILMLGDSITEGYGVDRKKAFPSIMAQMLKEKFPKREIEVVNAGISGSTSASGLARLKWQLRAKPTHLVLALGANDGLRGTDVQATKTNLSRIIDLAVENDVKVLLCGMLMPLNMGESYRKSFAAVFTSLAKEKQVRFMPFLLKKVGGEERYNQSDGIHPNEEGHRIIAQNVFVHIEKML